MNLIARSKAHVEGAGETYGEHARFALAVGRTLMVAGLACIVHALIPALFTDKASRTVRALQAVFANRALAANLVDSRGRAPIGLIALLSGANAAIPWLAGAVPLVALPLSILSLAMLAAAAMVPGDDDPIPVPA